MVHVITSRTSPTEQIFMYIASVGASPQIGEIQPFCDLFPVLSCPVLIFSFTHPARKARPIFALYGLYDVVPSYVAELVDFFASDPQRRSLRSALTCAAVIRRTHTELGRRAFAVSGPDVWNSLPPSLRTMTFHSAFRRSLKTHFYKLAFLSWFYWLCNARSVDFLFVWTRTINFRM